MKLIYKLLKRFPYSLALLAGLLLYFAASVFSGNLSGLLLNVSASLITIPIVIFTYEAIQKRIAKESNRDVSQYVKMNIDRELLSLLNCVSPLVIGTPTPGLNKVLKLLSMDELAMQKVLDTYRPMVFYLATDWSRSENKIAELLANEVIYNDLSIEERNIFIRLIGAIRALEFATDPRFYLMDGEPNSKYKIVKGSEVDPTTKLENRYLLMARTKKSDEFVVAAFNDINRGKYHQMDLLTPMKINTEGKRLLVECVAEVLECISAWMDSRGNEFILDSRNFRTKRVESRKK